MVVVIEEESSEQIMTPNKTHSIPTGEEIANTVESTAEINGKDVSEGFETASDGGDDDSDYDDDGKRDVSVSGNGNGDKSGAVLKDDSYQDALDDRQLFQKALTLANEAKLEGNALFKDGKYEDALLKYEDALQVAPEIPKPEPAVQVMTETPKPDSTVKVASEIPNAEPTPQAAPGNPKQESAPQVTPGKPKEEPAQQLPPEMTELVELRSICHSNRGVCYLKLEKYDETVKECSKALELNPAYIKALHRRGEAYEKLERYDDAIKDMKKILEVDPSDIQARRNIVRLEPLAREEMEKKKEEMMGKLKDLGNNILNRFGLTTDNFKAVQDPNTGSYSISFQR